MCSSLCLRVSLTVYGIDGLDFNGYLGKFSVDGLVKTLQRMSGLACGIHHLIDFRGSHVTAVNTADTFAVEVDLQHDLGGALAVFGKKLLQNQDHELHGREVIVEHDHLKHLRRLGALGQAFQDHGIARALIGQNGGAGRTLCGHVANFIGAICRASRSQAVEN